MNRNKAHEFIVRCICEMDGDGYQTWEDAYGDIPYGVVPDHWEHNNKDEITIVFGDDTYRVKVTKSRKN